MWDYRTNELLWVDIEEKKIHLLNPQSSTNETYSLDEMVGAAVPCEGEGVILALESGFARLGKDYKTLEKLENPEPDKPENRFNDGKCDAVGRFWAGTMPKKSGHQEAALYCINDELQVKKKINKVGLSNGLAWSINNDYMYFIDTHTRQVARFDYDLQTGNISNQKQIITIPEGMGVPDGMAIDQEGMLWIAHYGGSCITRWNPDSSELLEKVEVPALNVTSCTFGGPDLDELYITSARNGMTEQQLEEYPYSGAVFKYKPGVKGLKADLFRG
ncbi:hypothetical protein BTS2_1369 [Bacillus sp. TS-2]|nr:hypothetical protein BTS2_1369 [Bacillus sp. TS-2]